MTNFANRVAGLHNLATRRLGGELWVLAGSTPVYAVFVSRYQKVDFGDERFKNVDMTGVSINSTTPALRIPTSDIPEGLKRGDEAYAAVTDTMYYTVRSIEHDNDMTTIRLKYEAQ